MKRSLLLLGLMWLAPLFAKPTTVNFYFVNSGDVEELKKSMATLENYLESETGFEIKSILARRGDSYVQIIKAIGRKEADVAFINTFGYLIAHEIYQAEPLLLAVRGDNMTTYQGQIVVREDSKIKTLADLNGKKFAFRNIYSASGYLLPQHLLKQRNIKIIRMHYSSWGAVLKSVYNGETTAGATFYQPPDRNGNIKDARALVVKELPDIEEKLKIIALTASISNEPIMVRKGLNPMIKQALSKALRKFVARAVGRRVLIKMYDITGLSPTNNEQFALTRDFIKAAGIDLNSLIPGLDKKK